jgi:hypothetical protein
VSPKVRLVQHQLNDTFSVPMILVPAIRTQDRHRLIGNELEFHHRLTSEYRKDYEFAAAAIDPEISGGHLPPYGRHRPIKSGNFDYVMQHIALSRSSQRYVRNGQSASRGASSCVSITAPRASWWCCQNARRVMRVSGSRYRTASGSKKDWINCRRPSRSPMAT